MSTTSPKGSRTLPPPDQRWLALWLPRLPTDRLKRSGAAPADQPVALYAKIANAFVLTAVDMQAARRGLAPAMPLADARALCTDLLALEAEPEADAHCLDAIAAWCERYTPVVALDPPDGVFLDITGCAHLFGDEAALRTSLLTRLTQQGFTARAAIAPTPAAAWALSRFAKRAAVDREGLQDALSDLPVAALRLQPDAQALLRRFGFKRIGQIATGPRAPFAARAGQDVLLRLDLAHGRARQALTPRRPPPPVTAFRRLVEPILDLDAILLVAADLCTDVLAQCDLRGEGVRRLQLHLFGVDGATRTVTLGLGRAEHVSDVIMRLLRDRLSREAETFDAAFGFEALRLDVLETAPLVVTVTDIEDEPTHDARSEMRLLDALVVRLGASRVSRPQLDDTHAPERAGTWRSAVAATQAAWPAPEDGVMRRPLTLFAHAQPIEAMAEVPDGPPMRFRWRRIVREVARAEGPERITPHWLRAPDTRTRDYYRVEDTQGKRYWLYREGAYGGDTPPRWFVHGLFA